MARLNLLLLPLLSVLFHSQHVAAQSDEDTAFEVPDNFARGRTASDRPVYQIGSTLEVEWTTIADSYRVILCHITNLTSFQSSRGSTLWTKALADRETRGFNWTVDEQSFSMTPNVFFLAFQPLNSTAPFNESAYSQYFNLTTEAVTISSQTTLTTSTIRSVSSGASSAATSATSATLGTVAPPVETSQTTSTGSTTSGTAAPVVKASDSTGLSSGASIGLGVGLGIGGILIIILAYLAFVRYRKRKAEDTKQAPTAGAAPPYNANPSAYHDTAYTPHQNDTKPPMAYYGGPVSPPQGYSDPMSPAQSEHTSMYRPPSELPGSVAVPYTDYNPNSDMSDTSSQAKFGGQSHIVELPGR